MQNKKLVGVLGAVILGLASAVLVRTVIENDKINEVADRDAKSFGERYKEHVKANDEQLYQENDYYEDLTVEPVEPETLSIPLVDDTEIETLTDNGNTFMAPGDDDDLEDLGQDSNSPTTQPLIIVGDGDGEISRKSEEYRRIIENAYQKSLNDDSYTLVLFGKLYGLGARGVKVDEFALNSKGETVQGHEYNSEAISKLLKALES